MAKVLNRSPVKYFLKQIRWRLRRRKAAFQFGADVLKTAPIVFGNAMPKSGSHLLTQILDGLTEIGPFVNPGFPPVNRSENNQPLPPSEVHKNLRDMRPGDIRYGYLHAEEPYLSILTQHHRPTIFIYRDPRDMLVSHIFYATDMYEGHGMHRYYTEKLNTMEERINAAITGVEEPGFELGSVSQRYNSYWGWLDEPSVLCLKFEDLILDREQALGRLLDFLSNRDAPILVPQADAVELIKKKIAPKKSGTFRKGVPGSWREHFTDANKAVFNKVAGDLLLKLGYEQDQQW
jgi:hypothetical protein